MVKNGSILDGTGGPVWQGDQTCAHACIGQGARRMTLQTMIVLAATTVASAVAPAESAQPTLALQATLTVNVPEAQLE